MKLLAVLISSFLSAKTYCQIQGSIKDLNGNKIKAALVIAKDSLTNKLDSAKIEKPGLYCFYEMKPGYYTLKITAAGYESQTIRNIIITAEDIGSTKEEPDLYYGKRIDILMKPAKK